MRLTAGLLTWLVAAGCASSNPSPEAGAEPAPASSSIERAVDPVSGVTSVVLTPSPVRTLGPSDLGMRSLSVGAQYASRPLADETTREAFGLLFVTVTDRSRPIFERDRRLLLDIDGQLFTNVENPAGLNSLYGAHQTERGIEEHVVVPVGADVIRSLAAAESVKGRLGSWVMFELEGERLEGFSEMSRLLPVELPADPEHPSTSDDRDAVDPIGPQTY